MNDDIEIKVKVEFINEQSHPAKNQFVYAYNIEISNTSEAPVQLLSRYWKVCDANEKIQEVRGEGVVGETPLIQPNESYAYTSGVVIETDTGTMGGYYIMERDNGEHFNANIPTFALVQPGALH